MDKVTLNTYRARERQRRYRQRQRRIEYHPSRKAAAKLDAYMASLSARLMGLSRNDVLNEIIEKWGGIL